MIAVIDKKPAKVGIKEDEVITAVAHSNVGLIKYWGRRDVNLNLPNNSSISMTLDDAFKTTTSVLFSSRINSDTLYIDGKLQDMVGDDALQRSKSVKAAVDLMRSVAQISTKVLIVSENSFPVANSVAPGISGAAALVFAVANALNLGLNTKELSRIARQIGGSSCRSMYGGIVEWEKGSSDDGSDSYATQIVNQTYWPNLIDMVVITDDSKKLRSGRASASVETGPLYSNRPPFAEDNLVKMKGYLLKQDFSAMAEIIMKDSNNMHATMMDSWPPLMYLDELSKEIIYNIEELNRKMGRNVAAYTFDSAPNAHIITTRDTDPTIRDTLAGIDGIKSIVTSGMGEAPAIIKKSLIDQENLKPLSKAKK